MTIERKRNIFGLFNLKKELEPGEIVGYRRFELDSFEVQKISVISPDEVEVLNSIVLAPTDRHRPPIDKFESFRKEKINQAGLGGPRNFGIKDSVVWEPSNK